MRKDIKKIALSAIFSALIVVLILMGTFIELLDITVAAVCALTIYIVQIETKEKYPILVYITSSVLSLIFTPLSTATLYFVGFFGYYPILKQKLIKFKKQIRKLISILVFNVAMISLMLLFKAVFALQNEPAVMYVLLLITSNVFFFCFDYLLDVFTFIYIKKLRDKIKFIK
ncbi:MAG: hypothetical protein J6E38_07955 [Clostridia bacterium]|nr:hypothetical protein [Clostridia bacterium]